MKKLCCWLVGEQGLLIQCGQALLGGGHSIAGVTTSSGDVERWAASHGVAINSSARATDLLPLLAEARPNLLLSIGNDTILAPEILAVPGLGCVNYHDGPLPRYAGVHATTWALLNGESEHGVAWHRMEPGVDTGAILARRTVPIDPADTAFLLNLRCHEAGFAAFEELLSLWQAGKQPPGQQQDRSLRTLYPRYRRPPEALVINWALPAVELDRLCRATNFGGKPNTFGSTRVFLDGQFLIVLDCALGADEANAHRPGTVLQSSSSALHVATGTGTLELRRLAAPEGRELPALPRIPAGTVLPPVGSERSARLSELFDRALRAERSRLTAYTSVVAFDWSTWSHQESDVSRQPSAFVDVAIPPEISGDGEFVLGAFAAFWHRKGGGPKYRAEVILPPNEGIFGNTAPAVFDFSDKETLDTACISAGDVVAATIGKGPLLADFHARYPQAASSPSDLSIGLTTELGSKSDTESALHLEATTEGSRARLWYCPNRVGHPMAARIAEQFSKFLAATQHNPGSPVRAVALLNDHEYQLAVHGFNDSAAPYALDRTFLDLFLEHVRTTPHRIAVTFEGKSLTYAELNGHAAQWAEKMSINGIAPGEPAGVFLDRSVELVVAIIAVLKTGAIYLPLDPAYPDRRIEQIIQHTHAAFLVSERGLRYRSFRRPDHEWIIDYAFDGTEPPSEQFVFDCPEALPDRPAYLICTSGTSGKPKGVPILHRSLTNLLLAYAERTSFSAADRLMAVSSIGFDWSILDLFLPLAHGGTLEMLSSSTIRDGQLLVERIERGDITFVQGTPGTWRLMLAGGWSKHVPVKLASGGEAISPELAERLSQRVDFLFTVYGPTETAVVSSGDAYESGDVIHLGRPLANCRQYVLDDYLNPVGSGEVGEICIAGAGVSPGYLDMPDVNCEKFIPDHLRPGSGELLYRSGDLARLLEDGRMQFVTRRDQQVKLRGHRIELEEIESRMCAIPEVQDSVVVLRDDISGQRRLVGFVVMQRGSEFTSERIMAELARNLPTYMLPSLLQELDALPLTINKKIDRRYLENAEINRPEATAQPPLAGAELSVEDIVTVGVADLLGDSPDTIDADKNFIELGLDSIQLTSLSLKLGEKLDLHVELTTLYKHPTPRALAQFLYPRGAVHAVPSVGAADFPLSSIQRLMWTHEQLHPGTRAWYSAFAYRVDDAVSVDALRKAIESVVHRYSILRTEVYASGGDPRQTVLPPAPVELPVVELTSANMIDELRRQSKIELVDIPIRCVVLTKAGEDRALLLILHHRVLDGVTHRLLLKYIDSAYAAAQAGQTPVLPRDRPYDQFVERERAWLDDEQAQRQRDYWKHVGTDAEPADRRPPSGKQPSGASIARAYARWNQLHECCRHHSITPASAYLTAWVVLAGRRAGSRSLRITVPAARRTARGDADTLGPFMNLLPVRIDIAPGTTVAELWTETAAALTAAIEHSDLPFAEILRVQNRPAPQVAFYSQDSHSEVGKSLLFGRPIHEITQEGEIELALEVFFGTEGCLLRLKYDASQHTEAAASEVLDQLIHLLDATVSDPLARVDDIALVASGQLAGSEQHRATALFRLETPVHQLIAEQAELTPEAIAVRDALSSLTYRELDRLASGIGAALRHHETQGRVVGVLLDRDAQLPAVLLGILRAGAIYLPLDPGFPADRLQFILHDSAAGVIIAARNHLHLLHGVNAEILCLDDVLREAVYRESTDESGCETAYLIYTSGSTGRPKGTLIPHRALTNFLCAMRALVPLGADDRLLALTTISFDIAALELFLPLTCGATVDIVTAGVARDGARLRHAIESRSVTAIQATPATYRMLIDADWRPGAGMRVLCGGDTLREDLAERLLGIGGQAEVWNLYGPTEAAIWATAQRIRPGQPVTIGRPIANTEAYVLDAELRRVQRGVTGELFLAGECLAVGYHNRPELTAERFIDNPFSDGKMYRTGDLAQWNDENALVHVGRADDQIKLRGMRIEIGEIESALTRLNEVRDAAVILERNGGAHDQLVAFVRRDPCGSGWDPRADLARWLPAAMIPSRFVDVDELPLTPNNKLDRRALESLLVDSPMRDIRSDTRGHSLSTPRDVLRNSIAEVIGLDSSAIHPDRHLGEYGLDSIRFTKIAALLTSRLGRPVEPPLFYEFTTLAALEAHFEVPSGALGSSASRLKDEAAGSTDPIAVVGMSGIFAGSETLEEFWQHLVSGDDMITATPEGRWPNASSSHGSFVGSIAEFDPALFTISAREAEQMDPQQRLLLRCVWRLFENAGHAPANFAQTKCGVFIGASGADYYDFLFRSGQTAEPHALSGSSHAALANRISYLYDLHGPSATIDSACSSSLVAIHRAAAALRSGECTAAIAGGVSVILSGAAHSALTATNMLSLDGRCKSFDASADGYVRGEGAAVVLLRPLSDAVLDGDQVHGVILGSAENHGGRTNSLTAPSVGAQAEVIAEAQRRAAVDPRSIGYIEAHGTGTALGDPIEINGLKNAFTRRCGELGVPPPASASCGVGSLKTQFGHLEAAAGAAGLIKVLLAMRYRRLPRLLHWRRQNPMIQLDGSPFRLVTHEEAWDVADTKTTLRAGVSSFGFGGSNAHLVVEMPPILDSSPDFIGPLLFPISASDTARVGERCESLASWLERHAEAHLADVAFTLQQGHAWLEHRVVFVAAEHASLIGALRSIGSDRLPSDLVGRAADVELESTAKRWLSGDPVSWPDVPGARRIDLPGHPFKRDRFWLDGPAPEGRTRSGLAAAINSPAEGSPKVRLRRTELNPPPAPAVPTTGASAAPAHSVVEPAELLPRLRSELAAVLFTQAEALDTSRSFADLGVDSILAVEFARSVSATVDQPVQAADLYDHPNLQALAAFLAQGVEPAQPAVAAPDAVNVAPAVQPSSLLDRLRADLAAVLYMPVDALDPSRSLLDLGVDSILAIEFARNISTGYGRRVQATDLYDHPNLQALATFLRQGSQPHETVAAPPANGSGNLESAVRQMLARVLYCDPDSFPPPIRFRIWDSTPSSRSNSSANFRASSV
ncbi:amino acid adenylation domain-containing protein [Mycobacterium sp.]|uniref:amino acid adenylation domain-containing protein n=1 Tax=Mycobacterium sp. TaxID=1785 RepID=UPI003BACA154